MDIDKRLLEAVDRLLAGSGAVVIAIDGPCGGGKSTLAQALAEHYQGSAVIHADDYFLQPHQRTAKRLEEPGGNMDRERLRDEVLRHLHEGVEVHTRRYNCQTGLMTPQTLPAARLFIVEGSYTHHPELRQYYDLTVFLDADRQTQLARLSQRVPPAQMKNFIDKWMPMEDTYFATFDIPQTSNVRI